jgi:prepilin-type N-terminal cleavage/methylation domain-containing protein
LIPLLHKATIPLLQKTARNRHGFTLVEIIVILSVLSILAAVAIPVALRIFQVTAEDTTREEMNNIKKALLGDPQKLQTSFRNDFGLLGDIGCLPSVAFGGLDGLITQGTYPAWNFNATQQAGAGWKGPYITGTPGEDFKKDQWGNDYIYTPGAGVCPLSATHASNGADGLPSTADDITLNVVANETTATIRGTVKNTTGTGLQSTPVELYYPSNGTLTTSPPATTDAAGNYSFTLAPFGARAVKANPTGLLLVPNSVSVGGTGNAFITFSVVNYSEVSITIDNIVVNCAGTPATRYDDITVDGGADITTVSNIVCSPAPAAPGTDVTDQTFTANSTPPSALRVFVDSPDTQLPDLVLRGGTVRVFTIGRFETAAGAVSMTGGQTVTVSFYNTVAALISTLTIVTP